VGYQYHTQILGEITQGVPSNGAKKFYVSKNLVNFGPLTPEFAGAFAPGGLHAGLCHAFLVHSGLIRSGR